MTEIGRMIREDGINEGIKEGIKTGELKGKSEMLIRLLTKRFKKIPTDYKDKIMNLSDETIDIISLEIFDFESIEDVKKYF